ncbi:MAG: galactosyltransferase-related protein [Planctomycetota bacterium]
MHEPVHVIIPTHLPRYLEFVLVGLARQTVAPATIIVTCDTDDPAIGECLAEWVPRCGLEVHWVRRPPVVFEGSKRERLCQVRNNGVRYLAQALGRTDGRILVLDGDTLASDTCVEHHAATPEDLVYPYRINLTQQRTESLDAASLLAGDQTLEPTHDDRIELVRRDRRYRKHLVLRRFGLVERHKPKLLGGHFSVRTALYLELNGFDELYEGWGFKDDEFAERAARRGHVCTGGRPASVRVAVADILAWHLWHPTRQSPGRMAELPTYQRFRTRGRLPRVCGHGVEHPLAQSAPVGSAIGEPIHGVSIGSPPGIPNLPLEKG